ncbi:SGNH/GDSL hydrolase family protein [Puniceicoccus vermicola]|uniref:SGNH/GDSL hydrolase family protein n=1 Tax=Puniceicoccus vermicola TaxID=388746 RepID=A0A7X1E629_9BACT|nr:SGNH/GDSL hydrolase family protein [Puniceicoccus vermicola]MBC2603784.1 SGNH/GDSL hydrolase family protein [Puniceicoccus vermicola]
MRNRTIILLACCAIGLQASVAQTTTQSEDSDPSLREFHQKASSGEPVDVVFLGGSLTWGANASDPQLTSYRGRMMEWLREQYPETPIHFHDAAIGGSGSDLGLFRIDRDVLPYDPDLVFLDFTVNDGPEGKDEERLSTYETLMREIIESDSALMQVLMMFKWNVKPEGTPLPPRHQAHIRLGETYNVPVANVIPHVNAIVNGGVPIEKVWPFDGAHPDDFGYELFFEAVRDRFLEAIDNPEMVATIPEEAVYGDRYAQHHRTILKDSETLPEGWTIEKTYRTSLWFDGLSSRWMTDVICASKEAESQPLEVEFEGSLVGFFGERNGLTPNVNIWIDGEPVPYPKAKDGSTSWPLSTARFAPPKKGSGNLFMWTLIADDLDDGPHTLKIEPIWKGADSDSELRIESVCSAGMLRLPK